MERERWERLEKLYHSALELDESQRAAFVESACSEDQLLKAELRSLLGRPEDSFLETPALEVAAKALAMEAGTAGAPTAADSIAPQAAALSRVPAAIGRYRILSLLGEGGMGVVYEAEQDQPRRTVALKVIKPGFATAEMLRRFQHESQALGRLQHPGIAQIYEASTAETGFGPQPYFAMELIRGRALREYADEHRLDTRERLELVAKICDAVEHAHQRGVIHRDLNPGNILVDGTGQPKVLDFGVARMTETEAQRTAHTDLGQLIGTLAYMSPEQVVGDPLALDTRSDVYALGVILFELLAGKLPYAIDDKPLPGAVQAIREEEPPRLSSVDRRYRGDIETIAGKALEKEKTRRYASAAALADDIRCYLADEPITARRPSAAYRVQKFARRHKAMVAATASAVFFGLVILALSRLSSPRQAPPEIRPFTTYPGGEYEPTFSPDGQNLAFVWNGAEQSYFDIYVRPIQGDGLVRLTSDHTNKGSPAWSNDGKFIAFLRYCKDATRSGIYLVPARGGLEHKIVATFPLEEIHDRHLDWSPITSEISVTDRTSDVGPFAIYVISPATGTRRRLTTPPDGTDGDTGPAYSRDGRHIAFRRTIAAGTNDIYVIESTGGSPRRLTFDNRYTSAHAWSADGKHLFFASNRGGHTALWRVPASGGAPEKMLDTSMEYLAISPIGNRLAYSQWFADTNIWQYALTDPSLNPGKSLIASTRADMSPHYSRGGDKVTFRSARSGTDEIWMCDSDGQHERVLTKSRGPLTGSPKWSPDDQRIAFDSRPTGRSHIFTVRPSDSILEQITNGNFDDVLPSWSIDGRSIYFASNRNGSWQIWKAAAAGTHGETDGAVQISRHGGFSSIATADFVYYAKDAHKDGLWRVPVNGGLEEPVLPDLQSELWGYWTIRGQLIYFVDTHHDQPAYLATFDLSSHQRQRLLPFAKSPVWGDSGLAVSPDGNRVLYAQGDTNGSDIFLVEHIR